QGGQAAESGHERDGGDDGPAATASQAGEQDAHPGAGGELPASSGVDPVGELFAVPDPGGRGDDDPAAGEVQPPAEAQVVAEEGDVLVEAADPAEGPGPD